jgi:hypothetical protein
VGGFTEGKGSRSKSFGALLLGGYRDAKLRYFGHSLEADLAKRITGGNGAIEPAIYR